MFKRKSLNKNEPNTGCKRDMAQIEKKKKRKKPARVVFSPQKSKSNMGCVRETPQEKENQHGIIRETPQIKKKMPARDV